MTELKSVGSADLIAETVTLRYDYALGEVAGRFMAGLKQGKILATRCSKSALTYLPPRSYCERSFEKCDSWVEAAHEGVIEASTIVVRGFEGKRKPPVAIAFVRLDGTDFSDRELYRRSRLVGP